MKEAYDPENDAELDRIGEELIAHNQSLDATQEEPEPASPETTSQQSDEPATTSEAEQQTTDNSESAPEKVKSERQRDDHGRFTKKDESQPVVTPEGQEQPEVEGKHPSEFEQKRIERASKEKERQDRSWEALNREKDDVRQYRQQLEQNQAQLQQWWNQNQLQQRNGQKQISSRQMYEAAQEFDRRQEEAITEGDFEKAKENRKLVRQAMQEGGKLRQQEAQAAHQAQWQNWDAQWNAGMEVETSKDKELLNAESPLSKQLQSMFGEEGLGDVFYMLPDGFAKAVQVAKLRVEAGASSELREKLTKAEAELTTLRKATTPLGATPSSGPATHKSVDQMSDKEIDAELDRLDSQLARQEFASA